MHVVSILPLFLGALHLTFAHDSADHASITDVAFLPCASGDAQSYDQYCLQEILSNSRPEAIRRALRLSLPVSISVRKMISAARAALRSLDSGTYTDTYSLTSLTGPMSIRILYSVPFHPLTQLPVA